MAITLTTKKGTVVECEAVTAGRRFPVLHILTRTLTGGRAYDIFSDPEETEELTAVSEETVIGDDGEKTTERLVKVYRGYTDLYSVGPSPYAGGELLIWLNRPPEEEDEG